MKASLIDYTAPTMRRILLISSRNVEDHKMFQYMSRLKEFRRNYMYHEQRQVMGTRQMPLWQEVSSSDTATKMSTLTIANSASSSTGASSSLKKGGSVNSSHLSSNSISAPSTIVSATKVDGKGAAEDILDWTACGVCSLDTTWSNVLKSDASRARCTHHCRNCGTVVCTVCSPSGDTLMGEGE